MNSTEPKPQTPLTDDFRWKHIISPEHLTEFYETILPKVREAARQCGYAIAVHGSMKRDLDLIAAPWMENHSDEQILCKSVHKAACGLIQESYEIGSEKPCGRRGIMFPVCWIDYPDASNGSGHIDLSIMPDARSLELKLQEAEAKLEVESAREKCIVCNQTYSPSLIESSHCIFCISNGYKSQVTLMTGEIELAYSRLKEAERQRDDYKSAHDALAELNKDLCEERDQLIKVVDEYHSLITTTPLRAF